MKTFILFNGKTALVKEFKSSEDARDYVTNYFDHSLFVGYYEIEKLKVSLPNIKLEIEL